MFSTSRWMFVCVAASHYNFILFFFQSICFFSGVPGSTKTVGILVTLSLSERGQRIKALFCRLKGFCLPSSQAQLQGIYYCRKDGHLLKGTQNQVTKRWGQLDLCKKCPRVILAVLWDERNVLIAENIRRWQDSCKVMEWRPQVS